MVFCCGRIVPHPTCPRASYYSYESCGVCSAAGKSRSSHAGKPLRAGLLRLCSFTAEQREQKNHVKRGWKFTANTQCLILHFWFPTKMRIFGNHSTCLLPFLHIQCKSIMLVSRIGRLQYAKLFFFCCAGEFDACEGHPWKWESFPNFYLPQTVAVGSHRIWIFQSPATRFGDWYQLCKITGNIFLQHWGRHRNEYIMKTVLWGAPLIWRLSYHTYYHI